MTEKLVKTGNDYILYSKDKTVLGITSGTMEGRMLSLKNCQAIENGYDLDELFDEVDESIDYQEFDFSSFKLGFKKALEILGDKKFTKEDMGRIMVYGYDKSTENEYLSRIPFDEYIQSLQQTEWDVEICYQNDCYINPTNCSGTSFDCKLCTQVIPKLDADGCLILRRI